jgi:hypothetical protein
MVYSSYNYMFQCYVDRCYARLASSATSCMTDGPSTRYRDRVLCSILGCSLVQHIVGTLAPMDVRSAAVMRVFTVERRPLRVD